MKGEHLASLITRYCKGVIDNIDCVFLNACETLTTGKLLQNIGIKCVICWAGTVADGLSKKFVLRFYDLLRQDLQSSRSTAYMDSFLTACEEVCSGSSLDSEPCILFQEGSVVYKWSQGKMVTVTEQEALALYSAPVVLHDTPASETGTQLCLNIVDDDMSSDESDDEASPKNWGAPKSQFHFAAMAGQNEKEVLRELKFNLLMPDGAEISAGHGVNQAGMITKQGLKAIGISNYNNLWDANGLVAAIVTGMLQKDYAGSADSIHRVAAYLNESVYFRQLDVLLFRKKLKGSHAQSYRAKLVLIAKSTVMEYFSQDELHRTWIAHCVVPLSELRVADLSSDDKIHIDMLQSIWKTLEKVSAALIVSQK